MCIRDRIWESLHPVARKRKVVTSRIAATCNCVLPNAATAANAWEETSMLGSIGVAFKIFC